MHYLVIFKVARKHLSFPSFHFLLSPSSSFLPLPPPPNFLLTFPLPSPPLSPPPSSSASSLQFPLSPSSPPAFYPPPSSLTLPFPSFSSSLSFEGSIIRGYRAQRGVTALLDSVTCSGRESDILQCSLGFIGHRSCAGGEDVAVRCGGGEANNCTMGHS